MSYFNNYKDDTSFEEWLHEVIISSVSPESLSMEIAHIFGEKVYEMLESGELDSVKFEDIEGWIGSFANRFKRCLSVSAKSISETC